MALDILNAKIVEANGLLSKIQIGGKVYEIKDLIARQSAEELAGLLDALSAKVGNVADGQNLADIVKNIQENAYDDTAIQNAIKALQEADLLKADKEQVAKDIAAAVAAEAEIARAAEKANADEIARVDNVLKAAIENEDGTALNSIKELATWIEEHGPEAENMSKAITKNAEDIAAMDKAYKAADEALDGRLDVIEAALGEGEGSVADQIADAKDAAIEAAKGYTDGEIDKVEAEVAKKEDKANLKALAYKDSATGTVAGQTISGVKASGQSAGSITVELQQSEHDMSSTGKFTPAGTVTGTAKTAGSISVTAKYDAADATLTKGDYTPAGTVSADFSHSATAATLTKGDYTPAGTVSVELSGASFNAITGVGTQASFTEGQFTPASLTYAAADYSVAKEGLVGSVEDECLTFTAAGLEAISASKISAFDGGSKAADTFVANSLPTMAAQNVGVQSATFAGTKASELVVTGVSYDKASLANLAFSGTKAEGALVTGVSYQKADIGSATFTGKTVDIDASFTGSEGDISVAGKCHDYAVKTAEFVPAAIEVAVGDITVAATDVTVQ
jgi:uncharacterized protein YjbI with pentapeptide repeats